MTIPTIFETSRPRDDVLRGAIAEADFVADLARVVAGRGEAEYLDPARFFARTYPTRGLRDLLANVGRSARRTRALRRDGFGHVQRTGRVVLEQIADLFDFV